MKMKRISNIIAIVLLVTLLAGLVVIPGSASTISLEIEGKVWDPDTRNLTGFTDTRLQDGRIWTDKTVQNGSGATDFDITLSALSQSFPVSSDYMIPTDTVFIIDVSGSMTTDDAGEDRMRIDVLIEALNDAIFTLQDAHKDNRIAVVAYGGISGGYARVENLLELGRYAAKADKNFFLFNGGASNHMYLEVNADPESGPPSAARSVRVEASTPTQWGIFEGAKALMGEVSDTKTVDVEVTGGSGDQVTVTRRPNIVLMTDGEPTMGWSNYLFLNSPANEVSTTPAGQGYQIVSPTAPGIYFGDGSWGEMGVSLLTVLTAAHRKRLVEERYFGAWYSNNNNPPSGQAPDQPAPSVGFYSIAFGTQPPGSAQSLINATMNPGNPGFVPNVDNASGILWNIRDDMSDLLTSPNGPLPPIGQGVAGSGGNTFRLNPNPPPALNGYGGDMGNLLRAFAAPSPQPISFHVSRRQSPGVYVWDSTPLTITNTANLTLDEINFADLFATATNLEELQEVFEKITSSITTQGFQYEITEADPESEKSFDGYLSFSDVLGEYMQVKNVGKLTFGTTQYPRSGTVSFATAISGNTPSAVIARNEYINILYHHMNYGTDPSDPIYLSEAKVADLVASNIASSDFIARNSIKYYANTSRDFVLSAFSPNGTPIPPPPDAAAVVDVYPIWDTLDPNDAPPSGDLNLRTITFHVITALRTAGFAELYATNNAGDSMMRILNAGDQMIRWYIPSSLIPVRTVEGVSGPVTGNTLPIRIDFTVELDTERVSAGIPLEVFEQYKVPGTTDQMYFYSDRHNPNPTNVTLAFFRPHPDNPYYQGTGAGTLPSTVYKSANPTVTALHVNSNNLVVYNTNNTIYDLHWLGNNGRLTMKLVPPPTPPSTADLTILKTFTGIPSDIDVFDTDIISQISFLVIGTNAAGAEIYRETVFFTSSNFRWNDTLRGYEYTLRNVPLGTYRIYERGGNLVGSTVNRPGPPQTVNVTTTGQQVRVPFVNNYTQDPDPITPALTIWKTFHGLTNAQIPEGFRITITGPNGFSRTITRAEAIAGVTLPNLTPGQYTINETGSTVPGYDLTVTIDNQSRPLPYTFTILSTTEHIGLIMDNFYSPTPPPSPQTGLRDFTIPIIIFVAGVSIVVLAEVFRRKSKKKD